jgi:hypothetical protein
MNTEVEAILKTLPRKIKVGAYDWRVVIEPDEHDELCGQAQFEFKKLVIWPKNLTGADHAVGIVLHELLHIVYDDRSIVEVIASGDDHDDIEENIVLRYEAGLIALYRDNPKLLTWIKRGLKKSA